MQWSKEKEHKHMFIDKALHIKLTFEEHESH